LGRKLAKEAGTLDKKSTGSDRKIMEVNLHRILQMTRDHSGWTLKLSTILAVVELLLKLEFIFGGMNNMLIKNS